MNLKTVFTSSYVFLAIVSQASPLPTILARFCLLYFSLGYEGTWMTIRFVITWFQARFVEHARSVYGYISKCLHMLWWGHLVHRLHFRPIAWIILMYSHAGVSGDKTWPLTLQLSSPNPFLWWMWSVIWVVQAFTGVWQLRCTLQLLKHTIRAKIYHSSSWRTSQEICMSTSTR